MSPATPKRVQPPPPRLRVRMLATERVSRLYFAARAQPSAAENCTVPASELARVSDDET